MKKETPPAWFLTLAADCGFAVGAITCRDWAEQSDPM
jgi:hypothetical protein